MMSPNRNAHKPPNCHSASQKSKIKNRKQLSIMSWNIQDQKSDKTNKFEVLDFTKLFNKMDIICLQETKGTIKMPDYVAFNSNRKSSRSGGVAILVHQYIRKGITHVKCDETQDAAAIKLDKNYFKLQYDIYIITFYISPALSSYATKNLDYAINSFESVENIISRLSTKGQIILCGDANARTGCLSDYISETSQINNDIYNDIGYESDMTHPRNNTDITTNSYCHLLLDIITNNQLRIANGRTLGDCPGKFTCHKYNGSSTVDYFITSSEVVDSINSLEVLDFTSYSDHCPLLLNLNFKIPFDSILPQFNFDRMPPRYKWSEKGADDFVDKLNSPEILALFNKIHDKAYPIDQTNSEAIVNDFTEILLLCASDTLQTTKPLKKLPHKKWFDRDCTNSKRNLNRLARNLSRSVKDTSTDHRRIYFEQRNKHNTLIKTKRTDYLYRLNQSIENGHVLNWQKFKQLKQTNENKVELDKYDLLHFYEYFTSLYKKCQSNDALINTSTSYTQSFKNIANEKSKPLNNSITITEINCAIKKLHAGKSTSEDLVSNEMLMHLNDPAIKILHKIFNHTLDSGTYPWHTSIITPIFKSGNPYDPDNYRAIAVGSCLGKLFSSILLARLTEFKTEHCPDPIEQLGFQKGAQTNDHILTLKTSIDKYTKVQKVNLMTCFVDLKKAFDTVTRDLLLYKIVKLGVHGKFFAVIENMYDNSVSKIKINNLLSSKIKMERGTEQGHPLSPDLFKIFINDLSDLFYSVGDYPFLNNTLINHLLWADDLVLIALDQVSLQNTINILLLFCNKWGLTINLKKTKTLIFHHGRRPSSIYNFYLGEDPIECVTSYCYLGVVFFQNGCFKVALNELRKKALRALFSMKKSIIKNSLSINSLFTLFDSLVKPVLLYGCQIIFPHGELAKYFSKISPGTHTTETYFNKISRDPYEKFHLKYLKWCLSVHYKASNIGCWGDTGRYPLFTDALKLSTDYFFRAQIIRDTTLLHEAFVEQKTLNLEWYRNMNSITNMYNSNVSKHASINIRKSMQTLFCTKWVEAKNSSPKLDFYNKLKSEFCFEKYLLLTNYKYRNALTRLRISAHNLYVERGRYIRPPISRDNRVCIFCKNNLNILVVEDELHAINDCPLYKNAHLILRQSSVNCTNILNDIFVNQENNSQSNLLAGKLAYTIQETHNAFSHYYTNSQHAHQNTGGCVVM